MAIGLVHLFEACVSMLYVAYVSYLDPELEYFEPMHMREGWAAPHECRGHSEREGILALGLGRPD